MTANKRFRLAYGDENVIIDELEKNSFTPRYEGLRSIIYQLNNLNEENMQLKQRVAFLEEFLKSGAQYEYYQKVYEENEQLKQFKKKVFDLIEVELNSPFASDISIMTVSNIKDELKKGDDVNDRETI